MTTVQVYEGDKVVYKYDAKTQDIVNSMIELLQAGRMDVEEVDRDFISCTYRFTTI